MVVEKLGGCEARRVRPRQPVELSLFVFLGLKSQGDDLNGAGVACFKFGAEMRRKVAHGEVRFQVEAFERLQNIRLALLISAYEDGNDVFDAERSAVDDRAVVRYAHVSKLHFVLRLSWLAWARWDGRFRYPSAPRGTSLSPTEHPGFGGRHHAQCPRNGLVASAR